MSKLVIVESPTKAKTINKFLGKDYEVLSSYGHVRDLPKGDLGIDVENNFEPRYVIPTKARKNLTALKKAVEKTDEVILATDEDREGEAIAWHLAEALELGDPKSKNKDKQVHRIVFHEITKQAIEDALNDPRDINMNLVDAQQARRILDRLVGYNLSPFLWKKIIRGLSAGRVQSVAVRLIVEREREIQAFKPDEYWSIEALLQGQGQNSKAQTFTANLHAKDGKTLKKLAVKNKEEADDILGSLKNAEWSVEKVEEKETHRNPLPPFTTSTLQQDASRRFGYPAKRTMMLAQNLYERGLITYHRTDSLSIAEGAIKASREIIKKDFGTKYLPEKPKFYKNKSKGAQEAHEAIRPAFADGGTIKDPANLKLEGPQLKLYTLIWQRFIASQMNSAVLYATTVDVKANPKSETLNSKQAPSSKSQTKEENLTPKTYNLEPKYTFRATGQIMKFDGFLRVYPIKFTENELPELEKGEALDLEKLDSEQHFTKPPARYTEANLIKILEEHGIGRPSTYAPIISTIQDRNYVQRNDQKRLEPTEIGFMVTDLLMEHFPEIVDVNFTAEMENKLDEIVHGKETWQEELAEFYMPFKENLDKKYEEVEKKTVIEETDKICTECGKPMVIRMGRFGKFYACSGFPECKHTENIKGKDGSGGDLDVHCPKCAEGKVTEKRTRKGKIFYGCNRYPDCDFALWDKPVIEKVEGTTKKQITKCPECEKGVLTEKENKSGKKIICSEKECKHVHKT